MKQTFKVLSILVLAAAISFGQGNNGRGSSNGPANMAAAAHQIDPSKVVAITGEVKAVNISYGLKHPSIVVTDASLGEVTLELAPLYWLLENGFEVEPGHRVAATAAPCLDSDKTALFAINIENLTLGVELPLRDSDGTPLWVVRGPQGKGQAKGRGPGAGNQAGAQVRGSCIDTATITTVSGTVSAINMGLGIRMPALTLATAAGDLTVRIGPERILLEAGFAIEAGQTLTVRHALSPCTGERVALDLTSASGQTLKLRNDDGSIAW